jgi:hypothetical protein
LTPAVQVANLPPVVFIEVANLPPVSLIPVVHLDLRICEYLRKFYKKIQNDPDVIFRGWGGGGKMINGKIPEAKNLMTLSL